MPVQKFKNFDIESLVSIHSSDQLEIKLEYNLEKLEKTNNYKIETFFFLPNSLKINKNTYSKEEFYSDTKNYLRFMHPRFTLAQLTDPDFNKSPLYILQKKLAKCPQKEEEKKAYRLRIIKELKLLGTMVRARLRDWVIFVEEFSKSRSLEDHDILSEFEERMLNCAGLLKEFRKIAQKYKKNLKNEELILKYLRLIEEFISNLIEERLAFTFYLIEKELPQNKKIKTLKIKLGKFLTQEHKIRKKEKFDLSLEKRRDEKHFYRFNQYKKDIASVLYLDLFRKKKSAAYMHVIAAWAAFVAAAINFSLVVYISKAYAANTTILIFVLAIAYALKDRIKEIIRLFWSPESLSRFPDHENIIKNKIKGTSIKFGKVREKMFFMKKEKVDSWLLDFKNKNFLADGLTKKLNEEILAYQKEISVKTKLIKKHHTRTVNLTDITRFNLKRFMENMEDAIDLVYYWDEAKNQIVQAKETRVYYLGLILKHTKFVRNKKSIHYECYRLNCARDKIKNVKLLKEA